MDLYILQTYEKHQKKMSEQMQKKCLQVWMQYCVFDLALLSTRYVRSPAIVRDSRTHIVTQFVKLVC